mmetsp:Transcript_17774/g.61407  ORF Transcript_17774/g.61407 Transcript_17774/m.61407 type:complete len:216 (+) Transcript_17774:744-1391(+)
MSAGASRTSGASARAKRLCWTASPTRRCRAFPKARPRRLPTRRGPSRRQACATRNSSTPSQRRRRSAWETLSRRNFRIWSGPLRSTVTTLACSSRPRAATSPARSTPNSFAPWRAPYPAPRLGSSRKRWRTLPGPLPNFSAVIRRGPSPATRPRWLSTRRSRASIPRRRLCCAASSIRFRQLLWRRWKRLSLKKWPYSSGPSPRSEASPPRRPPP